MPTQDRHTSIEAVEALFIPRPLDQLCCVNPACPLAGVYAGENLSVRPSKGSGRYRILRCAACNTEFSERKGTALWGSRMAEDKALSVARHLQEGCGIRQTARLVGVSKDGVTSVAIRLGLHSKRLHDQEVKNLVVNEVQFDEKWSFVEKKREALRPPRSH